MSDPHGNEEWRPVVGYEVFYSVSNHGRVRRDAGGKGTYCGKIVNPWSAKTGHLYVGLSVSGKKTSHAVHCLVLIAFIGPPQFGQECRHWDGVSTNNYGGNLLWGTRQENHDDMKRHGTWVIGSKHRLSKLTEADVEVILCLRERGWTQQRIADSFCVCQQLVSHIVRGEKWRHITH